VKKWKNLDPMNEMPDMESFEENLDKHVASMEAFLSKTSHENRVVIGKVVKAITEMNGVITDEEKSFLTEFCDNYSISQEELETTEEEREMMATIMNDSE
jgi:phage terminase small subunit